MGHTPGPWAVYPPEMLDNKNWSVQTDCGMTIVCGEDTPEAAADARLIAAAPELLAACKLAVYWLRKMTNNVDAETDLIDIQEAIDKAEGRSE